jgi:hypothetical protein
MDHVDLRHHDVAVRGHDPLGPDVEAGELRGAADAVRERGFHAGEPHAVDDELDVLVEHLAPGFEVALIERAVVASGQRGERA